MNITLERYFYDFKKFFGLPEFIIQSPARVNIIGEHTDYNLGLALAFAANRYIWFLARRNHSDELHIIANDLNETILLNANHPSKMVSGFGRYLSSVLMSAGHWKSDFSGLDILFGGDIPIGAGMSSSSALSCGFIFLLNQAFSLGLTQDEMISWASTAENATGVEGGKMDQVTITKAEKDHALLLDFYYNHSFHLPLDLSRYQFALFNSNIQHNLVETEYNSRRASCQVSLQQVNNLLGTAKTIRQLDSSILLEAKERKSSVDIDKLSYVIEENERVLQLAAAIKTKEYEKVGALLSESHKGLSEKYKVSCPEIDWLVEELRDIPQVLGSRIMGGGFGGCVLALVEGPFDPKGYKELNEKYLKIFGQDMGFIPIQSSSGISMV